MKIIGFAGKARSGKDTGAGFALEWCRKEGLAAERMAFADLLKLSVARAFGIEGDIDDCIAFCNWMKQDGVFVRAEVGVEGGPSVPTQLLEGDSLDSSSGRTLTGRRFLQLFGTEAHREVFGTDFWVEALERELAKRAGLLDVVFLTDCRFPNEAQMVTKHDGEVWEVTRPDSGLKDGLEAHASETGLPEGAVTLEIANVGDLTDLQALIDSACETNINTEGSVA